MTHDREVDTMRSAWLAQPVDDGTIPPHEVRRAADAFHRRIRGRNVMEYMAAAVVIAAFGYYAASEALPVVTRVGAVLLIAGVLYTAWQLHRRASARAAPWDASASACLAFHRSGLERQRDALRSVWRWYLGPMVPGLLVFNIGLAPQVGILVTAPTIAVIAAAFTGIAALNRNAARALQQEIDRLPVD